jgi:hypothetical protein
VHRWFPWIEGFSEELPMAAIERHGPKSLYDPFLGAGTTAVVGIQNALHVGGAEVNPFLRFVTRVKTAVASELARDSREDLQRRLEIVVEKAEAKKTKPLALNDLFAEADYFERVALEDIGRVKAAIESEGVAPLDRDLALLALTRVLVDSSNMIRRVDLRRRRANETNGQGKTVLPRFRAALEEMVEDLEGFAGTGTLGRIQPDARLEPAAGDRPFDLCVTSPPYLNGTNYTRNTKLELWVMGLISSPADLRRLRDRAVTAGINNVRLGSVPSPPPSRKLERALRELEENPYDKRIPAMVAGYFADMSQALRATAMRLRAGSPLYLDIGDSRFSGVHVPTDEILIDVARDIGLEAVESVKLRDRRSKDGSPLTQRLIVFEAPRPRLRPRGPVSDQKRLEKLVRTRPFAQPPYGARNWGHAWHSMCSYQAKLKPSIAHFLVKEFSAPGDLVLDPFSGAGTIPLEACLQGRAGWGNDISPLASRLTTAKVHRPDPDAVEEQLARLLQWIEAEAPATSVEEIAGWGHNRSLGEYFHPLTLQEVVAARGWFLDREPDPTISLLQSAMAHVLHGNRPYALSRRSHPITPFAPTGPNEHRPVRERLSDKVRRLLAADLGASWVDGRSSRRDVTEFEPEERRADVVLTSPPFFGSTRFHVNNWMRVWFCGWDPADFDGERERYLEYRQRRDFSIYREVLRSVHSALRPDGLAVWHLGKSQKFDMAAELAHLADPWFSVEGCYDEDVSGCQSHGVSSQGGTHAHQFLLLRSR